MSLKKYKVQISATTSRVVEAEVIEYDSCFLKFGREGKIFLVFQTWDSWEEVDAATEAEMAAGFLEARRATKPAQSVRTVENSAGLMAGYMEARTELLAGLVAMCTEKEGKE